MNFLSRWMGLYNEFCLTLAYPKIILLGFLLSFCFVLFFFLKRFKHKGFNEFFSIFIRNKGALLGIFLVLGLIGFAVLAPFVSPHSPTNIKLSEKLTPPIWMKGGKSSYLLGTDDLGRDILSRLIYGSQISLQIALISVGISLFIGIFLGTLGGYYGRTLDAIIMVFINILLSLPSILLAIVLVAFLGPNLENAIIAIGIVNIPIYTRLIRAELFQEKEKPYVMASRLCGSSDPRLMFYVILPNCIGPVIVQATMGFGSAILEAAGLSFLSLGAQPPQPEWGAMLNGTLQYFFSAPWVVIFPGLAIFATVTGFNLMGDGLMDALNPKTKER